MAGVAGPVLVNYLRQYQVERGLAHARAYNVTMFIMAGLLIVGFLCNLAMKPVDDKHFMNQGEGDSEQARTASAKGAAGVGARLRPAERRTFGGAPFATQPRPSGAA